MKKTMLVPLISCIFWASCQLAPRFIVYNNSKNPIIVCTDRESSHIAIGKTSSTLWLPTKDWKIVIIDNNKTNCYSFVYPKPFEAYVGNRGAMMFKVQYETNCWLYLVQNNDPFPVNSLYNQPAGFPLKPTVGK